MGCVYREIWDLGVWVRLRIFSWLGGWGCGAESRGYPTVVRSIRLDASIVRYEASKLDEVNAGVKRLTVVRSIRLDAWLGGWVS